MVSMRNMFLVIANILKVTFRKKGSLIIYLFLPLGGVILSLLIYGTTGTTPLKVGITNLDTGALSAEIKTALAQTDNFEIHEIEEGEVNDKLLDNELYAAIIIPDGYSQSIYDGSTPSIEVVSVKGNDSTVWVSRILNSYTDTLFQLSVAANGDKAAFDNMLAQYKEVGPELTVVQVEDKLVERSMTLTSMGFLIMFIMLGAGFTNMVILTEKRNRTYHRICSAPVNARQYIAANALTSILIVIVQIILIQFIMKFILKIDTGVDDIAMFVLLLMFGLVAVGISLVITAFSSSSYIASTLNTLVITPTCMLGGCYWDVSLMPEFMQKISYFVPQRWVLSAIQKLQAGGGYEGIYLNLLIIAAFAAAFILTAIYRFSRSSNVQKFV